MAHSKSGLGSAVAAISSPGQCLRHKDQFSPNYTLIRFLLIIGWYQITVVAKNCRLYGLNVFSIVFLKAQFGPCFSKLQLLSKVILWPSVSLSYLKEIKYPQFVQSNRSILYIGPQNTFGQSDPGRPNLRHHPPRFCSIPHQYNGSGPTLIKENQGFIFRLK